MATPVNAEAFEKPHWRLVAEGFNWQELDIYFSARGGMVERNGGIESPNRTSLYVGTYYYRFVDLKAGPDGQQGGGWWLDLDQLTKIMLACPSRGLNLSQMARAFWRCPGSGTMPMGSYRPWLPSRLMPTRGAAARSCPGSTTLRTCRSMWAEVIRVIPMSYNSLFRTCEVSGSKRCPIFWSGLSTNSQGVIEISFAFRSKFYCLLDYRWAHP
jgi:hypothetical protein